MMNKTTIKISMGVSLAILFVAICSYPFWGYLLSPVYQTCEKINIGTAQKTVELEFSQFANNSKYDYFKGELKKDSKMGIEGDGILITSHFSDARCGVVFVNGTVSDKQFYFD